MYQGHLPDGSSVQKHSAGPWYPYVLVIRDDANGRPLYSLIGPGIEGEVKVPSFGDIDGTVERIKAIGADGDVAYQQAMRSLEIATGTVMQQAKSAWERGALERGLPTTRADFLAASKSRRIASVLAANAARRGAAEGAR